MPARRGGDVFGMGMKVVNIMWFRKQELIGGWIKIKDSTARGSPFGNIKLYLIGMRIIAKSALRQFWEKHPDAEQSLRAWHDEAKKAEWNNFQDIKKQFGSASIVGNDRNVFNIKGNDYRLIVLILFRKGKVFIRFVGTHKEYDKVNAKNI